MIDRRLLTTGLLSSAGMLLAGCGGSTLQSAGDDKKEWQSPFANSYAPSDETQRNRRTEPATVEELMQPGPLKEMALGSKTAKVTVIEYFSLTCPVCHAFHQKTWPAFRRKYIKTGKVYYIAREFPIGRSSGNATIALRCNEQNYFKTLNRFLAQQRRWVSQDVKLDAIHGVAAPLGLSRAKFDSCLQNQALIGGIDKVKERGRALGVIGTPTFFINGKQLRGALTLAQLSAEIDPLLG